MTQTINRQAVKAYAVALYELGLPKEDIETSVQIIESAPQLMEALSCPVVALKEKLRCVDRIFSRKYAQLFEGCVYPRQMGAAERNL